MTFVQKTHVYNVDEIDTRRKRGKKEREINKRDGEQTRRSLTNRDQIRRKGETDKGKKSGNKIKRKEIDNYKRTNTVELG